MYINTNTELKIIPWNINFKNDNTSQIITNEICMCLGQKFKIIHKKYNALTKYISG